MAAKIGVENKIQTNWETHRVYVCVFRPDNGRRRQKPPQNWCFNWRSVSRFMVTLSVFGAIGLMIGWA